MASFTDFGNSLLNSIQTMATLTSTNIADGVRDPVLAGLTIYLMAKGFAIAYGRIQEPFGEFILSSIKILLIAYFALHAANYVGEVIPFIRGVEAWLISKVTLSGGVTANGNLWTVIDNLWKGMMKVYDAFSAINDKLSWDAVGAILSIVLLTIIHFCLSLAMVSIAVATVLVNEVFLTIVLGFGPLFLSLLLFPITKSFFAGWMKSCVWLIMSSVLIATVLIMMTGLFDRQVNDIVAIANNFQSDDSLSTVWIPFGKFCVYGLLAIALMSRCPTLASQLISTYGVAELTIGKAFQSFGASAGGAALGAAATGAGRSLVWGAGGAVGSWGLATGNKGLQEAGGRLAAAALSAPSGGFQSALANPKKWEEKTAADARKEETAQLNDKTVFGHSVDKIMESRNTKESAGIYDAGLNNAATGASTRAAASDKQTPQERRQMNQTAAQARMRGGYSGLSSIYGSAGAAARQYQTDRFETPVGLGGAATGMELNRTPRSSHASGGKAHGRAGSAGMSSAIYGSAAAAAGSDINSAVYKTNTTSSSAAATGTGVPGVNPSYGSSSSAGSSAYSRADAAASAASEASSKASEAINQSSKSVSDMRDDLARQNAAWVMFDQNNDFGNNS